jgi:hypothetical protein
MPLYQGFHVFEEVRQSWVHQSLVIQTGIGRPKLGERIRNLQKVIAYGLSIDCCIERDIYPHGF